MRKLCRFELDLLERQLELELEFVLELPELELESRGLGLTGSCELSEGHVVDSPGEGGVVAAVHAGLRCRDTAPAGLQCSTH